MNKIFFAALVILHFGCTQSGSSSDANANQGPVATASAPPLVTSLATAEHTACAVARQKVFCWGNSGVDIARALKSAKNPRQVTLDYREACVLDDTGVWCVGLYGSMTSISQKDLKNPRQISGGAAHTCALDDAGVTCWGDAGPYGNVLDVPALKNPSQIAAGHLHTCAVDDTGLVCWGYGQKGRVSTRQFRQIALSQFVDCGIDKEGIECWNGSITGTAIEKLNKEHPTQISVDNDDICIIGDHGIACGGIRSDSISTNLFKMKSPNLIATAENFTCAADPQGVKCVGDTPDMGKLVPDFNPPPPPAPVALNHAMTYDEISGGRCSLAWNMSSANGMICSTQQTYSYFTLVDKTYLGFKVNLIDQNGQSDSFVAMASDPTPYSGYQIAMSDDHGNSLGFYGVSFNDKNGPNMGYVKFNGNSGKCAPVVSGSYQACLKEVNTHERLGDNIQVEYLAFAKGALTSVGNCNLKASDMYYATANFIVTTAQCSMNGKDYKQNDSVQFDLRDERNYPALTLPQ